MWHGFWSTANTILNESNFNPDAIEYLLDQADRLKLQYVAMQMFIK